MDELRDIGPGAAPSALYVHIPFCRERCSYCAFTTVPEDSTLHLEFVRSILLDVAGHAPLDPLTSLYLGGGTPGLLSSTALTALMSGLRSMTTWSAITEVTLEANPANITHESLELWESLGFNRISAGIQTFRDDVLRAHGRLHDSSASRGALDLLQSRWQHTWTADLLVGWVGQLLEDVCADVDVLLAYSPPHVSVYGLTVEPTTALARLRDRGVAVTAPAWSLPIFDDAWSHALHSAGLERYEVSKFARPGHRSRHNLTYWSNNSYLGVGPGASSSIHPLRWINRADLRGYMWAAGQGHGLRARSERVNPLQRLIESISVGLRTRDGIATATLDARFSPAWRCLLAQGVERLNAYGIQLDHGHRLALRPSELPKVDAILKELLATVQDRPGQRDAARGAVTNAKAD